MATMPAMVAARRPAQFPAEAGLLQKVNETPLTPKEEEGERRRIGSPPEQDHEEPGALYAPDREAEAEVLIALGASRLCDVRLAPQEEESRWSRTSDSFATRLGPLPPSNRPWEM